MKGGRVQHAHARLLVAPAVPVRVRTDGVDLEAQGFREELTNSATIGVVDAAWWPDYGVELPTRQIVLAPP